MKLNKKLVSTYLAVGIIPLVIASTVSFFIADDAIEKGTYDKLQMGQTIKTKQLETFFKSKKNDLEVLVETIKSIENEAFNKLEAIRNIKKVQIQDYYKKTEEELSIIAETKNIHELYDDLRVYHNKMKITATGSYDISGSEYKTIHKKGSF